LKHKVWIIPHSHYDAEVFIVESETLEIGYNTLIGALNLMRSDPSYKFAVDQTCLIEPFLRTYPEERAFFEEMIAAGRMDVVGGTVIMPDVNMPSGESFIRQVLFGKRFIEKELGIDVRTSWTIDTFGRHPQMPQLLVKLGFDQDAFQRLMVKDGPSEFYWQGIDGTRLFCHWMSASYAAFYGAPGNLPEFKKFAGPRIERLASRAVTQHLMAPAGADLVPVDPHLLAMVAAYNRSQDEAELVVATPSEYFKAVKAAGDFPTVTYDLNPAFQGCYSARIAIKQWNRKLETVLGNSEKFDALAQRLGAPSQEEQIGAAWQGVLFNQFHDIICGSHVDAVYHNTMDRYKASLGRADESLQASLKAIARQIDTRGAGAPVVVFNPLNWLRSDVVECPVAFSTPDQFELAVVDSAGRTVPSDLTMVERNADGSISRARVLFIARDVPANGYATYHIAAAEGLAAPTGLASSHPQGGLLRFELDRGWMENEFYRLEFDLWTGVITSIVEKASGWEVLAADKRFGNTIVKERDFGNFWQYNGPCKGDEFYPVEGRYPLPAQNENDADYAHSYLGDGNIRQGNAMLEFVIGHPFGSGHFSTRVRIYAGLPRIDIQTTLLNNDERVRYRAAFPTSIQGGKITYEIPFGAIDRPEGELPALNWVDYSQDGHGVTLLNLGLPGNNVVDGVMLISLLKCTALKEGYAEVGGFKLSTPTEEGYEKGIPHVFDYALVPNSGGWREAEAYRRGLEFNFPLIPVKQAGHGGSLASELSFIQVSGEQVVLSAVKACPGGMVVRVYEASGQPVTGVTLETVWPLRAAWEVNLMEKEPKIAAVDTGHNRLVFDLGAFEIKTFRLDC
jgi:alpha-mannosidase